eukprot:6317592-Pyramimonas_sp.AAC.1
MLSEQFLGNAESVQQTCGAAEQASQIKAQTVAARTQYPGREKSALQGSADGVYVHKLHAGDRTRQSRESHCDQSSFDPAC